MLKYSVNNKKGIDLFLDLCAAQAGRVQALEDRAAGREGRTIISVETLASAVFHNMLDAAEVHVEGNSTTARRLFVMGFRNGYAGRPATAHTALVTL